MKSLILLVISILTFSINGFSQNIGDYQTNAATVVFTSNTGWQTWNGTAWINATSAPTTALAGATITIQLGQTANNSTANTTINANIVVNGTLNVNSDFNTSAITINGLSGTLNLKNAVKLNVYGDVLVNTDGKFDANFNPGDVTQLIVYGNYTNNGVTDFWKAEVIIVGNLSSPTSSSLQNNGNLIVGGNLIGEFDVLGNGSGQIYNYDPNVIVQITNTGGGSIVSSSDLSGESQALQDLVVLVFSACYATINTTWNETIWSNGFPTMSKSVIIAGNYSGTGFTACSLTVNAGETLTITSNQTINIRNNIVNNGTPSSAKSSYEKLRKCLLTFPAPQRVPMKSCANVS